MESFCCERCVFHWWTEFQRRVTCLICHISFTAHDLSQTVNYTMTFREVCALKNKSHFYRIFSGTICWGSSHTIQKFSSKQNITVVCYVFFYAVNVQQNMVHQIIKTPMQLNFVITKTFENTVDIQFYSPLVSTFILTFFWVHALKGIRPPQMTPSFETCKSYFHIFSTRERKEHGENIQFKRTKA